MIPLQAYFSRWGHTPNVAARIAVMNPDGIEEGMLPRGWRPKRTFREKRLMADIVSVADFRQKWGDQVLLWVRHNKRMVNLGGKRRAVTYQDFVDPFH